MMAISIRGLKKGEFFVAQNDSGARAICQVTAIDNSVARGWRITTQEPLDFHLDTGIEVAGRNLFAVVSIEQPPDDIRDIMLGLDRRYRLGGSPALSKDEIRALLWWP